MTTFLIVVGALLALVPVMNTFANAFVLRTPPFPARRPSVAILIPARDEEASIGACVDAALRSIGADVEVIVLDDHSSDATREIVAARAVSDPRLRIAEAPTPPVGWSGKCNACQVLSTLTDKPFLLFVDADVRLDPEAAARLAPYEGIDLSSGVPRQIVRGLVETAVIPMINGLIYGYLPVTMMRNRSTDASLGAACGQMVMVRASAYRASGGHAAIATSMHDGLQLARLFRRNGLTTDLIDGTRLAVCRMYEGPSAVWRGFSKNATEGMARPKTLPVWTMLLVGGHLLPLVTAGAVLLWPPVPAWSGGLALGTVALLYAARLTQALKCREPLLAVLLHPLGVVMSLGIQWSALARHASGSSVSWRGRSYMRNAQ